MIKKPDLLDGILFYQAQAEKKNLPPQVYDYPEHVLSTLIRFQTLWMLPERSIPNKEIHGKFSQYIIELNELNELAGARINEALTRAYKKYEGMTKKFIISHPAAIKKLLIDVLAEMNREQRKVRQNDVVREEKRKEEEETRTLVSPNKFRKLRGD